MFYLVRVEDQGGKIISYFKAPNSTKAHALFESLQPGCTRKGDVVKLLDEDFTVLRSNLGYIEEKKINNSLIW